MYILCLLQVLVGNFKSDNGALRNTCIKRLINVIYYIIIIIISLDFAPTNCLTFQEVHLCCT